MIQENCCEIEWDSDPEGFFEKNKSFPLPDHINFKIPKLCFMKK